jgi:hypothetical protein
MFIYYQQNLAGTALCYGGVALMLVAATRTSTHLFLRPDLGTARI